MKVPQPSPTGTGKAGPKLTFQKTSRHEKIRQLMEKKLDPNALYSYDPNRLYGPAREEATSVAFEEFGRRIKRMTPEEREAYRVKLCKLLVKYSGKPDKKLTAR